MACHVSADLDQIGLARARLIDELAVEYHDQTIRQFRKFVQILNSPAAAELARQHRASHVAA